MTHDTAERAPPRSFAFGPFLLIPEQQLLLHFGTPVRMGGRALDILTVLVSRAGELVGKRELVALVWHNTVVEDSNLKVNMAALRRALGEEPDSPQYIATVVGRGYRFVHPVRAADLPSAPAVAAPPAARAHNLPSTTTRIVGRTDAIESIRRALSRSRLVSIVGPGGIGKTTVALAVAEQVGNEEDISTTFVDLARVASEEFVSASLVAALGINSGGDDSLQAIASILAKRKALLVFDTCEHVPSSVAAICKVVLEKTEHVRVLATSRQVLHVRGEDVQWLDPLEVPPFNEAITARELLRYSAPQLLAERAFEKTGHRLADPEAYAVAEICRRLDGSPLAIELVSSRFAGRSADVVLKELDDRFRTLRRYSTGAPLRQQTMLSTLEWSYALLTGIEATALRSLSIFAGSFDTDAAVAVVAPLGLSMIDAFSAIAGLQAKSMLSLDQRSGELRYRLLDTTRAFASNLLEDDPAELASVSRSHARLQLATLVRAGADHASAASRELRTTFGSLIDDLRAALDWALYRAGDPMLGIELVVAGLPLWHELSLGEESRRNCERAMVEFDRLGCADAALKLKLAIGLGSAHNTQSGADLERTIKVLKTAVELARETGNARAEHRVLSALATYQLLPDHQNQVPATLLAMREAAIRAKDRSALWEHELRVAEWESLSCQILQGVERLKKLRAQMRSSADDAPKRFYEAYQQTKVDVHLAALLWLSGCPDEATLLAEEAADAATRIPHGSTLAYCLAHGIIWTLNESHLYERARFYADLLKSTVYRYGMAAWIPIANCYCESITALSGEGSNPEALRAAFEELRNGMMHLGHHSYHATLIKAMIAIGQTDDAARSVEVVMRAGAQRWLLPEFLRLRASTERTYGRVEEAKASLMEAIRIADENECLGWKLRSAFDLATLLTDEGRPAEARRWLAPVYAAFGNGGATADLRRSEALLAALGRAPVAMR